MSLLRAKEYLKKYNLDDKILTFDESSATVKLASIALGIEEGRIAKTLSFVVNDKYILIVSAGDVKIDNAKYKREFGIKAKMIEHEMVEEKIGHKIGGVCPFGVNDGVLIYLDESLKKYDYVYPACGESNNAIKLFVSDLEKIINYEKWIDVTKEL